ncbi:hypothetical protein HDU98_006971 [Podochytrium sp. JEL0797]|nr:hypothetical protein HDU98_006971 [Podochytrium sp. JEL0797]
MTVLQLRELQIQAIRIQANMCVKLVGSTDHEVVGGKHGASLTESLQSVFVEFVVSQTSRDCKDLEDSSPIAMDALVNVLIKVWGGRGAGDESASMRTAWVNRLGAVLKEMGSGGVWNQELTALVQDIRGAASDFEVIRATSKEQIERCMAIRMEVFSHEQGFNPAIEINEIDAVSLHYLLFRSGSDFGDLSQAIGVARSFEDPADKTIAKIGRVAVVRGGRLKGAGKVLMLGVEDVLKQVGGFRILKLHSVCAAAKFYEACGYTAEGDIFDDEGCPHVMMSKKL